MSSNPFGTREEPIMILACVARRSSPTAGLSPSSSPPCNPDAALDCPPSGVRGRASSSPRPPVADQLRIEAPTPMKRWPLRRAARTASSARQICRAAPPRRRPSSCPPWAPWSRPRRHPRLRPHQAPSSTAPASSLRERRAHSCGLWALGRVRGRRRAAARGRGRASGGPGRGCPEPTDSTRLVPRPDALPALPARR